MDLGAFSVSLAVKDLARSRDFYAKLGFEVFAGDLEKSYLIMKNGTTNIGLFQGMFDTNTLTFNPGWAHDASPLDAFTDVRDIVKHLEAQGIEIQAKTEGGSGPGHAFFFDPDGNPILIDQHR